jgi:hypothetical protein
MNGLFEKSDEILMQCYYFWSSQRCVELFLKEDRYSEWEPETRITTQCISHISWFSIIFIRFNGSLTSYNEKK